MPKEYINPNTLHTPTGYTHVVKSGTMVFMAGQVGLDNNGQLVGKDDAEAQTRQALTNLEEAVRAAGGKKEDIMSMTIFLVNRNDISGLRKGMSGFFDNPPANTLLIISGLARPEFLIEIEARAIIE
jgi:enamine deaminase RidA (YjgF/YER057c/UK114 family)